MKTNCLRYKLHRKWKRKCVKSMTVSCHDRSIVFLAKHMKNVQMKTQKYCSDVMNCLPLDIDMDTN
jgi:hypothetical protein